MSTKKITNNEIAEAVVRMSNDPQFKEIANQPTIDEFGNYTPINYLKAYEIKKNEFAETLMNKIFASWVTDSQITNILEELKTGATTSSQVVEYYAGLIKEENYDVKNENPHRFNTPNISEVFHFEDYQKVFECTVAQEELQKAISREFGLQTLLDMQVKRLRDSANLSEYNAFRRLIETNITNGNIMSKNFIGTTQQDFLVACRQISSKFMLPNSEFNTAKVITQSRKDDIIILINPVVQASVSVNALASSFNLNYSNYPNRLITFDSLEATDLLAVVMDINTAKIWDTLTMDTSSYNAKALTTNYFRHEHKILSISPFNNAVAIKGDLKVFDSELLN